MCVLNLFFVGLGSIDQACSTWKVSKHTLTSKPKKVEHNLDFEQQKNNIVFFSRKNVSVEYFLNF